MLNDPEHERALHERRAALRIDGVTIRPHDPMRLHCALCGRPTRMCCDRPVWACECRQG